MELPQKTKNRICGSAIPLLGIYPDKIIIQKGACTPMLIEALFTTPKTWEQPICQLKGEWIKKSKKMNAIFRNMSGPGNYHTK